MQEDEGKRRRLSSEMGCTGAAPCVRCGSDDCAADSCAAMGRSSSGCSNSSSDTMLVNAVEDEAEPNPLAPGLEEVLRSQLACWGHRLVQLQPKVHQGGGARGVPLPGREQWRWPHWLCARQSGSAEGLRA